MKKLFGLMALLIAAVAFTSCGDDNDEPAIPIKNIVYSTLTGGATNYETNNEKYYIFDINLHRSHNYIYIYNVKFDPRMPISITMRIPLEDVPMTFNNNALTYTIEQKNAFKETIIPELFRGSSTWTPYAEREITNLKCTVDHRNKKFSIAFTCMGTQYEDFGDLYIPQE